MEFLGTSSAARAVSANGKVIVGRFGQGLPTACRWEGKSGVKEIASPINNKREGSLACAINHNGSVIAGITWYHPGDEKDRIFIWTPDKGRQFLEDVLTSYSQADKSLLPAGWILTGINAMTPSGTTLVGEGTYNGQTRAWKAVVPNPNLF